MKQDLISIVIPTYNRSAGVCVAIDSAIMQSHHNWEALVIDDGSTDDTAQVIASRYKNEPRVKYFYRNNGGASAARNEALKIATGDFIAFLDSDDIWEPWKLEFQLACFQKEPEIGMVWTNMAAIDPSGRMVNARYLSTMYRSRNLYSDEQLFDRSYPVEEVLPESTRFAAGLKLLTGDIFSQMITGSVVHTSTVMLRRSWQQQVGLFNQDYRPLGEDFDFHLRTTRLGRVGFVDVSSIQYQIGAADALTDRKNIVYAAKNFLAAIEPFIQKERHRIKLSDAEVRKTLAYGYGWYGSELVVRERYPEARKALFRSLRQQWNLNSVLYLGLTLVPVPVLRKARQLRMVLKKGRQPNSSGAAKAEARVGVAV